MNGRRSAGLVSPAIVGASLTRLAPRAMAFALLALPVSAAQAPVITAVVEHRAVANGLGREIQAIAQQGRPVWVGYRVPIVRWRSDRLTSAQTCCGRCRLEPPTDLVMLLKVDRSGVVEFRSEAVDCDIDASGAPLVWLDNVRPEESVSWLAGIARESTGRPGSDARSSPGYRSFARGPSSSSSPSPTIATAARTETSPRTLRARRRTARLPAPPATSPPGAIDRPHPALRAGRDSLQADRGGENARDRYYTGVARKDEVR